MQMLILSYCPYDITSALRLNTASLQYLWTYAACNQMKARSLCYLFLLATVHIEPSRNCCNKCAHYYWCENAVRSTVKRTNPCRGPSHSPPHPTKCNHKVCRELKPQNDQWENFTIKPLPPHQTPTCPPAPPLTANRTWHKFKHSPFTPSGFSLSSPLKSNFSLNSSSVSTRQVFAGLFLLTNWGSSSVPYLEEAVPRSCANSHSVWRHPDAAHPVIVTSQDTWINPPKNKRVYKLPLKIERGKDVYWFYFLEVTSAPLLSACTHPHAQISVCPRCWH